MDEPIAFVMLLPVILLAIVGVHWAGQTSSGEDELGVVVSRSGSAFVSFAQQASCEEDEACEQQRDNWFELELETAVSHDRSLCDVSDPGWRFEISEPSGGVLRLAVDCPLRRWTSWLGQHRVVSAEHCWRQHTAVAGRFEYWTPADCPAS